MDDNTILQMKDKVALITGGGAGIGRAIALLFAQAGMRVAVAEINEERADKLRGELQQMGADSLIVRADVREAAEVAQLFEALQERYGTLMYLLTMSAISWASRSLLRIQWKRSGMRCMR